MRFWHRYVKYRWPVGGPLAHPMGLRCLTRRFAQKNEITVRTPRESPPSRLTAPDRRYSRRVTPPGSIRVALSCCDLARTPSGAFSRFPWSPGLRARSTTWTPSRLRRQWRGGWNRLDSLLSAWQIAGYERAAIVLKAQACPAEGGVADFRAAIGLCSRQPAIPQLLPSSSKSKVRGRRTRRGWRARPA